MPTQIIAVIHYTGYDQALRNAAVALSAGCAGCALIGMDGGKDEEVVRSAGRIKKLAWAPGRGEFLVGANLLSMAPADAFEACHWEHGLDFTWVDDAGVRAHQASPPAWELAAATGPGRYWHRPDGAPLLFVGAGFKTMQDRTVDAMGQARSVATMGWVPTTSGPGTGIPPAREWLADMARGSASAPGGESTRLALASGLAPGNAEALLPYVTHALVATGISADFHTIDPEKARIVVGIANRVGGTKVPSNWPGA